MVHSTFVTHLNGSVVDTAPSFVFVLLKVFMLENKLS